MLAKRVVFFVKGISPCLDVRDRKVVKKGDVVQLDKLEIRELFLC